MFGSINEPSAAASGAGLFGSLDPWGLALMGGGMGLSALSGLMGGASTNRGAREARDRYAGETSTASNRLGSMVYGGDLWDSIWRSGIAGPDQQKYANQYADAIGGPIYKQLQTIAGKAGSTDVLDSYNADTANLIGARDQGAANLYGMFKSGADAGLGAYDRGAAQLTAMLNRAGKDREGVIRTDAAKNQRQVDAKTLAALSGSGLGNSTVKASMLGANARAGQTELNRSLTDLFDLTTGQKVGLGQNLLNTRAGMQKDYFDKSAQAMVDQTDMRNNTLMSRLAGKTQLQQSTKDAGINAQRDYLNYLSSIQSGNVMNPWLGVNTSQFYPGASGAASALGSLSGGLNDISGLMLAQSIFGKKTA